jgi:hypothetical protein
MRNEKGGKPLKTNNSAKRPISHPQSSQRLTTRLAKPFISLGERNPFAFAGFSASSRAKTQSREINGGFGARAADVARVCDSEMAPQAVGIAQNGLVNAPQGWRGGKVIPKKNTSLSGISTRRFHPER